MRVILLVPAGRSIECAVLLVADLDLRDVVTPVVRRTVRSIMLTTRQFQTRQDTRDHAMEIDAASGAMMASLSACRSLPKVRSPPTPPNAGVKNIDVLSRLICISILTCDARKGMCTSLASSRGICSDPTMQLRGSR
jgi:hypothetical protein